MGFLLFKVRKVKLYGDGMVTDHSSDLLAGDRRSATHVSDVVDSIFTIAVYSLLARVCRWYSWKELISRLGSTIIKQTVKVTIAAIF